jgi:hypothetical protein
MPLIHPSDRYYEGDLIVYYYTDFEEDEAYEPNVFGEWASLLRSEVTPVGTLTVAEYQSTRVLQPPEGMRDIQWMEQELITVNIIADVEITPSSYVCRYFDHYSGRARQMFGDVVVSDAVMGAVAGKLDTQDPYACRAYLRNVAKRYRDFFKEELHYVYHYTPFEEPGY